MPTDNEELARLTDATYDLLGQVERLNGDQGRQFVRLAQRAKLNRRMIILLAVSLLADAVLTAILGFALVQVRHLTSQVGEAQKLTKSQVLCPLYQQFINADTPQARALAEKNGQDLAKRDEAFRVIHHSYQVLKCDK